MQSKRPVFENFNVGKGLLTNPFLLSIPDTCRALGIGRTFTYRLIAEGKLTACKIGGRTVIEVESIRQLVATLPRIEDKKLR